MIAYLFNKQSHRNKDIKIGYFGKSDSDLIYQDEVHGPLIEQVDKIIDLLYSKYLKALIWYDGIQRVETFMFPREGCRELILNSVQHKDYSQHIPIQISVYSDRVCIYNIGEMPTELLPTEKLFKKHPSMSRNPNIATAFFRSGMVEGWGRGYEKIAEACKISGADLPSVEADFGGLMVRIEASQKYKELMQYDTPQSTPDNLSDTSRRIYWGRFENNTTLGNVQEKTKYQHGSIMSLIACEPSITTQGLAEALNLSERQIQRKIKELKDIGLIERSGSAKKGYWKIVLT